MIYVNFPQLVEKHSNPFEVDISFVCRCHHSFQCADASSALSKYLPLKGKDLRDLFESVKPGYHMNKLHWNTIILDGSIPQGEIERMIDHSYGLVVKKLKKAEREALELSHGKEVIYRD